MEGLSGLGTLSGTRDLLSEGLSGEGGLSGA